MVYLKPFHCKFCKRLLHSFEQRKRHVDRHWRKYSKVGQNYKIETLTSTQYVKRRCDQNSDDTSHVKLYVPPRQEDKEESGDTSQVEFNFPTRQKNKQESGDRSHVKLYVPTRQENKKDSGDASQVKLYVPTGQGKKYQCVNDRIWVQQTYKCTLCQYCYQHKYPTQQHERTHTGDKTFKCSSCSYSSAQSSRLKETFKCDKCKKAFKWKTSLRAHTCIYNNNKKQTNNINKQKHKQTQQNKKIKTNKTTQVHKCNFCQYSSKYKHVIQVHERVHRGDKPFKCSSCSYSSVKASRLKEHEQTKHTRKNLHSCQKCDYKAATATLIRRHQCKHNEKTFKCDKCKKTYKWHSSIQSHVCKYSTEK
ncbi:zinc finger Y-chromosomal protein-like [Amphiura filiformis]|uniref:zinc finger Y-chromosomal protein-like n=1 Tax=Amphiura filiformis TaxID=82378 RepID=UPI003B228F3F